MLLIPRPPEFDGTKAKEAGELNLPSGTEAVPVSDDSSSTDKQYRLITVGKKKLPDSESGSGLKKETFWASVTAVGEDLSKLAQAFEAQTYDTKTRGVSNSTSKMISGA
jgi:hypothetical protein